MLCYQKLDINTSANNWVSYLVRESWGINIHCNAKDNDRDNLLNIMMARLNDLENVQDHSKGAVWVKREKNT